MQRGVASRICFGPVVQMAIPILAGFALCWKWCLCCRSTIDTRPYNIKENAIYWLLNAGSMKIISHHINQRLQIKCDNFDCTFAEVEEWKNMLWEQLVDLQSLRMPNITLFLIFLFWINPSAETEIFHINQAITMAVDALVPRIPRPSAAMILERFCYT